MTTKKPIVASSTETVDIEALRESLRWCDALSQGANKQIVALAELTLQSLKGPDGLRLVDRINHLEHIAHCLEAISALAFGCINGINCAAEEHGCNHKDYAMRAAPVEGGRP